MLWFEVASEVGRRQRLDSRRIIAQSASEMPARPGPGVDTKKVGLVCIFNRRSTLGSESAPANGLASIAAIASGR